MKWDWSKFFVKLTSRKLWAMAAGVVMGLAMAFGLDAGTIETVSGAVVSISGAPRPLTAF